MKRNSALANLGWPFSGMEQDGTMNWTIRVFEPELAFGSAMVSLRGESIRAFAQINGSDGAPTLETQLEWRVADGMAIEASSSQGGAPCDFGAALEAFQHAISLADPPVFAPSSESAAGPTRKGGSL